MEHCWEEGKIFLLLASINLPGLKWVLRACVQEHSHILWASNLDSRTVSPRLGVLPAGWVHPKLPALLTEVIVYIYHYCTSLHTRVKMWPSRRTRGTVSLTASAPGVWLSARGDSNDNCLPLSLLHSKYTRAAELENAFLSMHFNMQPRGKSVLEAAWLVCSWRYFSGGLSIRQLFTG